METVKNLVKCILYYSRYYHLIEYWRGLIHQEGKLVILGYHNISRSDADLDESHASFKQRPEIADQQLELHLQILKKLCRVVSLQEGVMWLKKGKKLKDKLVVIPFDDSYESFYTLAFPLLKKFGFEATFFLTSDFIDKSGHLSKSQIFQMSQEGMEFGSHVRTHRFLSTLNEKELKNELQESKTVIEDLIRKKVELLSLPGGYHSSEIRKIARDTGFKGIFTSRFDWNTNETGPFELRRISLAYSDSLSYFISLIKMNERVYFKKRLKGNLLNILKVVLGPNDYFKLWDLYHRKLKY